MKPLTARPSPLRYLFLLPVVVFGVASILATSVPTDIGSLPASQIWVISWMPDCGLGPCGTNVTVLKGGAISQRGTGTGVVSIDGRCTYSAPISGQWSGTIFKFTMNCGGCGELMQGFTQGVANGNYGTATEAHGTISWTFNNSPTITQTWTASLLN
jgi:hypothetical protein